MAMPKKCMVCMTPYKVYAIERVSYPYGSKKYGFKYRYYRRRYECANCGDRYTSYEIDQRDFDRLIRKVKIADKRLAKTDQALKEAEKRIADCRRLIAELQEDQLNDNQSQSSEV